MSMTQSKLMLQLNKEQKICQQNLFSEEKLEELYSTISKIEPKNLMLVEFLSMVIEKNLIKNSNKLNTFVEMFDEIKGKKLEQESSTFNKASNSSGEKEEQKFNKKKFLKLLKDMAKLLYPGDAKAYEATLFNKLIMPDHEEHRMKVDQNLKKYLNEETILSLTYYQRELELLFEVFMPENYNSRLDFCWNEIRLLEKRLPIICVLRVLYEAEICPQVITQTQFLEVVSKMIPSFNSNHKEVMFYYSETFNSYMRESIFLEDIKLLEGDMGVSFLEFQLLVVRLATDFCKENKTEYSKYIDKFMSQLSICPADLRSAARQKKEGPKTPSESFSGSKITKLHSSILRHQNDLEKSSTLTTAKPNIKKESLIRKEREQFNRLIDTNEGEVAQEGPFTTIEHECLLITKGQIQKIKRSLDNQLGPVPSKEPVLKENEGYFNPNEKFTVIGEQLPKLQEKNKPAAKPDPKQKKEDELLGFKPQVEKDTDELKPCILSRKRKLRINTEFPVILSEVFYPHSFQSKALLELKQEQEIFLETTYIHLGERMYEEAFLNFQKAKNISSISGVSGAEGSAAESNEKKDKKLIAEEFFFSILEAQIFESAGRDEAALIKYNNAREISINLPASEKNAKAFSLIGLSSAFYHLQDYEMSLRCLLKAKQSYGQGLEIQSSENAILVNNIACCYMILNRNQEAAKQFNISHQIFDLISGRFDEKTLVVQQNISKNKKAYIEQMPSFNTMWKTYQAKSQGPKKADKKGAKAKK